MEFAVQERDAEVHDRVAGDRPALSGVLDPLVD